MKKIISQYPLFWLNRCVLVMAAIFFIPHQAYAEALNCNNSCKSQCTTEQWWGGNLFDFTCYSACQFWQLPNCYDRAKNELRNDIWGEVGPYLYVAGGNIIAVKNAQTQPVGLPLTPQQKLRLFDIFSHFLSTKDLSEAYAPFIPEFLSRVRIRWDAKMLDELNMEELRKELTTPVFLNLELLLVGNLINWPEFIGSRGQTWGLDIYINFPQGYLNEIEETVLLAHELIHTLQYLKRGSSLHAFGNDYFRGFESSGYNYYTIPMEQEAFIFDNKVRDWLISNEQGDHWNFELCNKSNVDTIWAAAGHFIAGLSLVPISHSVGWYRLDKGATCTRILTDIRAGDEIWYIATSDPAGIYPTNQWGHNGSKTFCIDTVNAFDFESSYRCNGPTEAQIHTFESVSAPSQTGATKTINLTGGVNHSVVELCNDHSKKVMVAQLAYVPRNGGWISSFWTPIDPSMCINNNFGVSTDKVYYYAYSLDGAEWPVAQNPSQVEFCVITELDVGITKHDRNLKCELEGGVLVRGVMIEPGPIITTVHITPSTPTHTLTLKNSHTGLGRGKVISLPSGISCGETCSASFNGGIVNGAVTLTALPDSGSNFAGWSGCTRLIGSDKCFVVMTKDKIVEAKFTDRPVLVVDKQGTGSGSVVSTPSGIDCGLDCIQDYDSGSNSISLEAKPSEGSIFTGWFGFWANKCGSNMNVDSFYYCLAQFDKAPTDFTLSVSKSGTGAGVIFSANPGIDCGEDCAEVYERDAQIALVPRPDRGSVFRGWNGACSGTGACKIWMYAHQHINATFETATPKIFTVSNLNDSGTGSLRQAILEANSNSGNDTVDFGVGLKGTIALTSGQLDITDSLIFDGPGAKVLAISGYHASRIFEIDPGTIGVVAINGLTLTEGNPASNGGGAIIVDSGTVTINNCNLTNNSAGVNNGGGGGGAIRKFGPGKLTVSNSTVSNNSALDEFGQGDGGGIRNDQETLTLINSTVTGNAAASGGGVAFDDGRLAIINSTVTGNSATYGGGGIFTHGGELVFGNSLVAGNKAPIDTEIKNFGEAISQGHNLFGENGVSGLAEGITLATNDLILAGAITTAIGPLADNGGQTQTHLPVDGGPANDTGDNDLILQGVTTDQRGSNFPRIMNSTVDIGAAERIVTKTLSVTKVGSVGTISSYPVGIDCGNTCTSVFTENSEITLSASPDNNSTFKGWGGDCTGNETCEINLAQDKNVVAHFTPKNPVGNKLNLAVDKSGTGSGLLTSKPAGIQCGKKCSVGFKPGKNIKLFAKPSKQSVFSGWSGDCSGQQPCLLTMDQTHSVSAAFDLKSYPLSVTKQGSGSVTSDIPGIDCGSDCSESYSSGTQIILTATPDTGVRFVRWKGACKGKKSSCKISMLNRRSVTAIFIEPIQ